MSDHDIIPTRCGAIETLHIAHILDQLCKGYITGCNSQEWQKHEIKHSLHDIVNGTSNVLTVFFRFEYQKRRTIHLHMLVWLKCISDINVNGLSATIPTDNEDLAFLVTRIQPSD